MAQGPMVVNMGNQKDWLDAMSLGAKIGSQMANVKAQFELISMEKDQANIDFLMGMVKSIGAGTTGGERQAITWMEESFARVLAKKTGIPYEEALAQMQSGITSDDLLLPQDIKDAAFSGWMKNVFNGTPQQTPVQGDIQGTVPPLNQAQPPALDDPNLRPDNTPVMPPVKYDPNIKYIPDTAKPVPPPAEVEGRREINPPDQVTTTDTRQVGAEEEFPPREGRTTTDTGMVFKGAGDIPVGLIEMKPIGETTKPVFNHVEGVGIDQIETLWETSSEMATMVDPSLIEDSPEHKTLRGNIMFGILNMPENIEQMAKITDKTEAEITAIIDSGVFEGTNGINALVNDTWSKMKDIVLPMLPGSLNWMSIFGDPDKSVPQIEKIIEQTEVAEELLTKLEKTENPTIEQYTEIDQQFEIVTSLVDIEKRAMYYPQAALNLFAALDGTPPTASKEDRDAAAYRTIVAMGDQLLSSPERVERLRELHAMDILAQAAAYEAEQNRLILEAGFNPAGGDVTIKDMAYVDNIYSQINDRAFGQVVEELKLQMDNTKLTADLMSEEREYTTQLKDELDIMMGEGFWRYHWERPNDVGNQYFNNPSFRATYDLWIKSQYRQKGIDSDTASIPMIDYEHDGKTVQYPSPPISSFVEPLFGGSEGEDLAMPPSWKGAHLLEPGDTFEAAWSRLSDEQKRNYLSKFETEEGEPSVNQEKQVGDFSDSLGYTE